MVTMLVMILVKMLSRVIRLAGKILSPRWQTVSKSSKLFCFKFHLLVTYPSSKSVHYVWMQLTPHNIGFPSWGLLYLEFPSPVDTLGQWPSDRCQHCLHLSYHHHQLWPIITFRFDFPKTHIKGFQQSWEFHNWRAIALEQFFGLNILCVSFFPSLDCLCIVLCIQAFDEIIDSSWN